jgi:hypothetical protein
VRGERDSAAGCSWSMSLFLSPKGQTRRLQRRGLSALCSPCSRASRRHSGPPFFGIITIAISIYRGGDGDDRFCGASHVRQTWDGCYLNPLGDHLGKSPKRPVRRNATLAPSCALYAFCAAVVRLVLGLWWMTYRIPRHTRLSLPIVGGCRRALLCAVEWSREGKPIATLALRVVVLGLLQPPTPIRSVYTEVTAQQA